MDDSIRQRLIKAEGELFSAYANGEDSLRHFDSTWSALVADVTLHSDQVGSETLAIAHDVASHVSTIADCLLEVQNYQQYWPHKLRDDWEYILNTMGKVDISSPTTPHSHSSLHMTFDDKSGQPLPSPDAEAPNPFIAPSYAWLLKNIHNPYPSPEVKNSIARTTNSQLTSINAWFINVRRRMGWTALCREHFHNCRADALDAAYRALVQEDPKRKLEPQIGHAFMQVKVAAEGLYSASFTKSALAGKLDAVVKDMTEEDRLKLEEEKKQKAENEKRHKEEEKEMRRRQRALEREAAKIREALKSYPSPDHSRSSSPVPTLEESLTDEESEDEDDDIAPPIVAGHKRRASSSLESCDFRYSPCEERPMKRLRQHKAVESLPDSCVTGLPSPVPSSEGSADAFDYWTSDTTNPASTAPIPAPPPLRKRRLSDADAQGPPKRARGPFIGPRVHAVSDPLPRPAAVDPAQFEDWFKRLDFEFPQPVTSEEFDSSALLDVELFSNWSFPDNSKQPPPEDSTTQFPTPLSSQSDELLQTEAISHVSEALSSPPIQIQIAPVAETANGVSTDDLFNGYFVDPLALYAEGSQDSYPSLSGTSQDKSSLSYPTPSDILNGEEWDLLFPSSQPPTFEPSQPSYFESSQSQTFSQALSEIDLSMLQLPIATPSPITPDEAARLAEQQAKFDKLRALEEATRQLQQELGVVA
ncbi:hypothetical protein BV22DRAFT_1124925 [Leucogyrophana mollusca]|uniref:Uncharacterized protein n=1 Tax=Leucogyrophana mollusca TaxID=85980 RepID=A0ACB8BZA8_9AGAM|nr:hypothetical protein BV22DRAFT_1124925 [Leucogyrophana mollusca]